MANVKISDLTALTAPATGDLLAIVDVSEALPADQTKKITLANLHTWTAYTPSFTGFSVDPVAVARYCLVGKLCTVVVQTTTAGTSNATSFTISAPFTAATVAGMVWQNSIAVSQDNGVDGWGTGRVYIASGASSITLDSASGVWTNSGDKKGNFTLIYEIA